MGIEPKHPSTKGPAEFFTGDVWVDRIMSVQGDRPLSVGHVHFSPGARTAWHAHVGGQTLYVTDGTGRVQLRGEDVVELHPGDTHFTPDAHEHWHGAAYDHLMSHISITQGPATFGDHVTDEEYDSAG